ncbi:hypothetical protein K0M31_017676 [Melipona bicolor]|uniref:Uncharacterized protein n=1 Tax=Melipona bicolor TaxID=60889 RepID=A0AA40G5J2_9HYME|nr:hypothetical protein K0M31_017676 [Melipona bicolor]
MTMTTTPTTPTSTSTMTVTSMAMPFVPVDSEASISSSATDQRQQRRWQWQQAATTTCPITATSSSTYLSATPSTEASKLSTNVLFSLPASPKRSAPESSSKTPAITKSQMKGEFFCQSSIHEISKPFLEGQNRADCEFAILIDNHNNWSVKIFDLSYFCSIVFSWKIRGQSERLTNDVETSHL